MGLRARPRHGLAACQIGIIVLVIVAVIVPFLALSKRRMTTTAAGGVTSATTTATGALPLILKKPTPREVTFDSYPPDARARIDAAPSG